MIVDKDSSVVSMNCMENAELAFFGALQISNGLGGNESKLVSLKTKHHYYQMCMSRGDVEPKKRYTTARSEKSLSAIQTCPLRHDTVSPFQESQLEEAKKIMD